MKLVYFGMDAMAGCLLDLLESGHEVLQIFTMPDEAYDRTAEIAEIARKRGIPCTTERVTAKDIEALADAGAELSVTAGYVYRIPVSGRMLQVNLHPALLPVGRGGWPLPYAILKGVDSGVTIHRLSEEMDAGDILLQERIPLAHDENLVTLLGKVQAVARRLLGRFMEDPFGYASRAVPQGPGEYWPDRSEADRVIRPSDDAEWILRKHRAFAGYGCIVDVDGVPWVSDLVDGRPCVIRPYFRDIRVEDGEAVRAILRRHPRALSDFTFSLLYSWRRQIELSICIGPDFFVVRSQGYDFFPVGERDQVIRYLGRVRQSETVVYRFCGEAEKQWVEADVSGALAVLSREDCDYVADTHCLALLEGPHFAKMRNAIRHYAHTPPEPRCEPITAENIGEVLRLSESMEEGLSMDGVAERDCLGRFFELGCRGLLVRRGGQVVSYTIYAEKDARTAQGHFNKSVDDGRGAVMYLVHALARELEPRYDRLNIEEDLGQEGLRSFKLSLLAEVIPSYTVTVPAEAPAGEFVEEKVRDERDRTT